MVILYFATLLCYSDFIKLAPVDSRPIEKNGVGLVNDGIAYSTISHFFVWDQAGHIEIAIQSDENETFEAWYYDENRDAYFIATQKSRRPYTKVYNHKGVQVDQVNFFSHYFRTLGNDIFTLPFYEAPNVLAGEFPFLFTPIHIEGEYGEIAITPSSPQIAKMPEALRLHRYNYKDAWITHADDGYLVVNELEPKVYTYTHLDIHIEKREGIELPTKVQGKQLALNGFIPIKEKFDPPQGIHDHDSYQRMHWNWWYSHSLIVGFQKYPDGFLIAYEVPDCDENGDCRESLLALQKLDAAFQPVGEPRVQPGIFAGVRNGQIYVLQFERRLTLPVPEPPYQPRLLILDSL